ELAEVAPPHWLQQGQPDSIESQDEAPEQGGGPAQPGTTQRWTAELRKEARVMYQRLQAEGVKDYAARTAAHYGVTPQRLREVLSDGTKAAQPKKKRSPWDI